MRALSIGVLAKEALEAHWPAQVIGVTSGGVFILVREQWVLFLTYSPFHAPGTINLERSLVDLKDNENGSQVLLGENQILFPERGLVVEVNGAQVWDGGMGGSITASQRAGIVERLRQAALTARAQKGAHGLAPALPWLVGKGEAELDGDVTEKVLKCLADMRIAIRNARPQEFIDSAGTVLGHGRGLTPAADDAVAGVLLTLNRWREVVKVAFDLEAVNKVVVGLARTKTTSLSATIIHAAASGQGDERILRVLDGIIRGDASEKNAIQDLIMMGHSSGVDSLAGIALALTA